MHDPEDLFTRRVAEMAVVPAADLRSAVQARDWLASKDVQIPIDEILLRMGVIDEATWSSVWSSLEGETRRPDRSLLSPGGADPSRDDQRIQRAIAAGRIDEALLKRLRRWQAEAWDRGLELGVIEILYAWRRPAQATARSARASSRSGGRTTSIRRRALRPSRPRFLVPGLAGLAVVCLVVAVGFLVREDPVAPPGEDASVSPGRAETPEDRPAAIAAPYVEWPRRSEPADVDSLLRDHEAALDRRDSIRALASIEGVIQGRPVPDAEDFVRRAEVYFDSNWLRAALSDLEAAERAAGPSAGPRGVLAILDRRAQVRMDLFDLDGALEDATRLLDLAPDEDTRAHGLYVRGSVLAAMGRLDEAIEHYDRSLRIADRFTAQACRGMALMATGDRNGAEEAFARARRAAGDARHAATACAALLALAEVYPDFDTGGLTRARSILDSQAPRSNRMMAYAHLAHGVVRFLEGDRIGAWSSLASSSPYWRMAPQAGLLYVLACLDAGAPREGGHALRNVLRIRPALARSIDRPVAEARRLVRQAAAEAAELAGQPQIRVRELEDEFEHERNEGSRIACLERTYRFEDAARRWDRLRTSRSKRLADKAARKAARDRILAEQHARLLASFEGRRFELAGFQVADVETRVVGAGASGIVLETAGERSRLEWPHVPLAIYLEVVRSTDPPPEVALALASLAADEGLDALSRRLLDLACMEPGLRPQAFLVLAERLGVEVPAQGFVRTGSGWVLPGEVSAIAQGLVPFRGDWVSPAEERQILAGCAFVGGRWIETPPDVLRDGGLELTDRGWVTPVELRETAPPWTSCSIIEGDRFTLETDRGKRFAFRMAPRIDRLLDAVDVLLGGGGSGGRIHVRAYKDFEGYRARCAVVERPDGLDRPGFSSVESRQVQVFDRFGDVEGFEQDVLYQVADLSIRDRLGEHVPEWLVAGLASVLEVVPDDENDPVPPSERRLAVLRRIVAVEGRLDLDPLARADGSESFRARAWGLCYLLLSPGLIEERAAFDALVSDHGPDREADLERWFGADRTRWLEERIARMIERL